MGKWWDHDLDLFAAGPPTTMAVSMPKVVKVSSEVWGLLQEQRLEACREVWSHTRGGKLGSWSMWDVSRVFEGMMGVMEERSLGVRVVPE